MTAELVWAVVAAAGDGRRLGQERPKAFAKLGGRPLLAHAVELFEAHPRVERVVVVVPEGWEEPTALLADELAAGKVAAAVPGGATRALSVAAGLAEVSDSATAVLVHDAARPLTPTDVVLRVLAALQAGAPAVVPVLPVVDTTVVVDDDGLIRDAVAREPLRRVQTPQGFDLAALRAAYADLPEDADLTDDAAVMRAAGVPVSTVPGDDRSAKITVPHDLELAELLLGR